MNDFVYEGNKTKEISFPLGGIGTGCIGLSGNGQLVDWEIFNKPDKGSFHGFSHFAVRAERNGRVLDARVLHGDLLPPYSGSMNPTAINCFGFGPPAHHIYAFEVESRTWSNSTGTDGSPCLGGCTLSSRVFGPFLITFPGTSRSIHDSSLPPAMSTPGGKPPLRSIHSWPYLEDGPEREVSLTAQLTRS